MLREEASPVILRPSDRVAHHDRHGLALKKFLLRCLWDSGVKSKPEKESGKANYPFHKTS
jgi:hypothetical protein